MILCLSLFFATWISITRINDFGHFPFQIITGGIIGIFAALISYRLHFGNLDWFIGDGNYLDHMPTYYKFKDGWSSEEEVKDDKENSRENIMREVENEHNNNSSSSRNNRSDSDTNNVMIRINN